MVKSSKYFLISASGNAVLGFQAHSRAKEALEKVTSNGTKAHLVSKDGTGLDELPMAWLVTIHNEANPESPVKGFRSLAVAAEKVAPLLPGLAVMHETESAEVEKEESANNKSSKAAVAKKGSKATTTRTRAGATSKVSQYSGKKIHRTPKGMGAHRREDTRRTRSWNVLKDGMVYEDALKAGALSADLMIMNRLGHISWK